MLFMNPTDQTLSVIFLLELVHVPALERTLQWYIRYMLQNLISNNFGDLPHFLCNADECQGGLFKAFSYVQVCSTRELWTGYHTNRFTPTKRWCLLHARMPQDDKTFELRIASYIIFTSQLFYKI